MGPLSSVSGDSRHAERLALNPALCPDCFRWRPRTPRKLSRKQAREPHMRLDMKGLLAAVLLIALGSDYNVFIAGRIRAENRRRRLREAIAVAAPTASRAITVAGIVGQA